MADVYNSSYNSDPCQQNCWLAILTPDKPNRFRKLKPVTSECAEVLHSQ